MTELKVSNLSISTCTVITNLNSKINLGLLSRFITIYDQNAPKLDEKAGGVYNLEFYGNCARGETLIDKIKDEFNNQATLKFKYWGFRNINIKVFANGKLQMTGPKYEDEANIVGNLLIAIIKNIKINIINDINNLDISNLDISENKHDFQLVYNQNTNQVYYYRKKYNRFINSYNFDTNIVYDKSPKNKSNVNFIRKGYEKDVHDKYNDTIESKYTSFLNKNNWSGDNYIKETIDLIDKIKEYFYKEIENILSTANNLETIKSEMDIILQKYSDFSSVTIEKITIEKLLIEIGKKYYNNDDTTIIDIKSRIYNYAKQYKVICEKKINRLINIRTIDISICNYVKKYLDSINNIEFNTDGKYYISLEELEQKTNIITEPHNYFVSDTETVMINSDLSINHNINLKKMSKVLKKIGMFNTYYPDEYPGVLTKYYYNPNNKTQGICSCIPHCSTKEKHSVCTKITISIFRPGSIIITGPRNTTQLMLAHDLIIKILREHIDAVKGTENEEEEDSKQIGLLNNEFRKISRKPRLFYFKKSSIIDYDKVNHL
jgi:TATA-box binding protein (TBP) (component of TFIID and TFIIIB)